MEGTPSGALKFTYYAMAEYLSIVFEGFCFTNTKSWNAPEPGLGVILSESLKPSFLYLCISILRQVKRNRQVYLYFACLEIKVFAPCLWY